MRKALLRKHLKERRTALSRAEVSHLSKLVQERFIASSLFADARVIAAYHAFKGEVETGLLLEAAIKERKKICLPRVGSGEANMDFVRVEDLNDLVSGSFGIKEPQYKAENIYSISDIDVFIVPALAFEPGGGRMGMGKGYYDRALAAVPSERLVGFAYEFQLMDDLFLESHDIKVGSIVTEKRHIKCLDNI